MAQNNRLEETRDNMLLSYDDDNDGINNSSRIGYDKDSKSTFGSGSK